MVRNQDGRGENMFLDRVWRTGGPAGRTLYAQLGTRPDSERDPFLGVMGTPELAAAVVATHNAALGLQG